MSYRRLNSTAQSNLPRSNHYRSFNEQSPPAPVPPNNNNNNTEQFNNRQQHSIPNHQSRQDNQNLENIKQRVKQQQLQRDEQIQTIKKEHNQHLENRPQLPIQQNQSHDLDTIKKNMKSELKEEFMSQLNNEKEQIRTEMQQKIEREYREKFNAERHKLSQQFNTNMKKQMENSIQQQIEENKNLSINDITEKYQNSGEKVDGYHILEVNRILQTEPSLNFEQARSLANSNGCLENGSNTMCPSKKVEHYAEKGNCAGGKCKVQFSDHKEQHFEAPSPAPVPVPSNNSEKIKQLDIEFYSNDRCGFCHRSKDLFTKEGVLEFMTIKNNQPLPKDIRGYPHFHSNKTGKHHTGAPSSINALIERLS